MRSRMLRTANYSIGKGNNSASKISLGNIFPKSSLDFLEAMEWKASLESKEGGGGGVTLQTSQHLQSNAKTTTVHNWLKPKNNSNSTIGWNPKTTLQFVETSKKLHNWLKCKNNSTIGWNAKTTLQSIKTQKQLCNWLKRKNNSTVGWNANETLQLVEMQKQLSIWLFGACKGIFDPYFFMIRTHTGPW